MIEAVEMGAVQAEVQSRIEPLLLEVADVVNTTLDLDTTLRRVAELVRKVIDYEIFGILLLNEKTQELYFRFSVGHSKETADRIRVRVGEGVTGVAAQRAEAVLVDVGVPMGPVIASIHERRDALQASIKAMAPQAEVRILGRRRVRDTR